MSEKEMIELGACPTCSGPAQFIEGGTVRHVKLPAAPDDGKGQPVALTDAQIKHMVDRFLGWRLPENFSPDAGISFKPTFNDHLPVPMRHMPIGTNLFDATQADAMVRYMVDGMRHATFGDNT